MKLTFLGANHEVTGSCTMLEAAGQRFLIDYGMEQGKNVYENQPLPVAPGEIDFVLITHAHIDHTGLLPLLAHNGFRGRIYATIPTVELCGIMLRDSAHIQEFEAEWKNRKGKRSGAEPVEPMYTVQDAEAACRLFRGVEYGKRIQLATGIEARFVDVGRLLGSASIELWITEGSTTTKLVFSGDIGNLDQPIIKDPAYIQQADYVFMESTYGDRNHAPRPDYVAELAKILQRTFDRGGNVVVPSFAVGRTQEMLYFLREIKEKGLVKGHGNFPVYIDSPLAIEATRIFKDTDPDCFDEDTRALLASIDRVSLIISEKLKSPLRCVFGDGLVSITTKTAIGDAADQCPIDGDGQELEIGFNNKYLMDALKAAPAEKLRLEFTSGVAPCVILPAEGEENFIYMVLPVRLKAN